MALQIQHAIFCDKTRETPLLEVTPGERHEKARVGDQSMVALKLIVKVGVAVGVGLAPGLALATFVRIAGTCNKHLCRVTNQEPNGASGIYWEV